MEEAFDMLLIRICTHPSRYFVVAASPLGERQAQTLRDGYSSVAFWKRYASDLGHAAKQPNSATQSNFLSDALDCEKPKRPSGFPKEVDL
jgi:hypothetical protein